MPGNPSSETSDGVSVPPGAAFVAALGGDVYYWVGSSRWRSITPLARIWFPTEEAARKAGYSPSETAWDELEEFEILEEIGRGGSAIVYRARDRALGRDVAIKVIPSNFGADQETVARFGQEARLLAGLRHPNIVAAYSVKQLPGGGLALVMEYVSGRTLRDVINAEAPLPVERVERILREVASALSAAHAHGIIHRDVKPDNIFLDATTDRALLADFGVALNLDNPAGLTMAGTTVGTPNYMSPEQIDGRRVDGRSDLYSLGLIGWEMLVGEKPWEGESLYSVIYKQKHEDLPALRALRPDAPVRLTLAIEGALVKDPRARWEGLDEFLQQLDDESLTARWEQWSTAMLWKRRAMARLSGPEPQGAEPVPLEDMKTVVFRPGQGEDVPEAGAEAAREPAPVAPQVSAVARLRELRRRRAKRWRRAAVAVGVGAVALVALLLGIRRPLAPDDPVLGGAGPGGGGSEPPLAEAGLASGAMVPALTIGDDSLASVGESLALAADSVGLVVPPDSGVPDTLAVELPSPVVAAAPSPADAPPAGAPPAVVPAAEVLLLEPARSTVPIAAGGMHSCGIAGGALLCWGGNDRGQLGIGGVRQVTTPVGVESADNIQAVYTGSFHTCALSRDGSALCWGENGDGQLGSTVATETGPVRVPGQSFAALSLGSAHSCGIGRDERAYCWGSNANGQLGDGGRSSRATPSRVQLDRALGAIAAGWNHTCAVTRQGEVFCWGRNDRGQLGDGSTSTRTQPVAIAGAARFTSVTAGAAHTCATSTDGETFCWGQNTDGRLGDGTTSDRSSPVRVRTTNTFVQLSAGGGHTCGLTANGTAFCWGQNNYGQLGTGNTEARSVPTRVQTEVRFTSLSSSGAHTCGRTAEGVNYCWGYNIEGQVGDGSRTHRTTPQRVEPLPTRSSE